MNRREMLGRAAGLTAAGALAWGQSGCHSPSATAPAPMIGPAAKNGFINQSIVHWCFELFGEKWSAEKTCQVAKKLGCTSVELVAAEHYPMIKKYGLTCAICQIDMNPDPPFLRGFNNPDHWPRVMKATQQAIDAAAANGFPNVICFTGYSAKNPSDPKSPLIPPDEGAKNCVEGLKKVIGYAEQKQVTLCLEMLNSRETSHPMKGHPGYQGDHTDYCIDIIKRVGSPRMKLLFDVYHVQIMDGDIIRRIRQYRDYIGHVHTAGYPGRGELDDRQEINYRPSWRRSWRSAMSATSGQEFIPTARSIRRTAPSRRPVRRLARHVRPSHPAQSWNGSRPLVCKCLRLASHPIAPGTALRRLLDLLGLETAFPDREEQESAFVARFEFALHVGGLGEEPGRRLGEEDERDALECGDELIVWPGEFHLEIRADFISAGVAVEDGVGKGVFLPAGSVQFADPDVAESDGVAMVLE